VTLLVLFAFVAGAGTAISPCVLPVLPALLSAGATGGRRRPLAIVIGLATTFAITIAGFAKVVDGVGLGNGALRTLAVVVLVAFGAALLAPRLADRIEAPLSRLARFGPRSAGDGFRSGLGVGAALGFVYAPCAGPILAAVISVGAASGTSVAIAVAYSIGSAAVLFALALGGRRLLDRVRAAGRGPALQRALGVVMLATALAVATDADVRFQTALADHFPSVLVNPTGSIERSDAVSKRLAALRGEGGKFARTAETMGHRLPVLGTAPEFTGNQRWFNTPGGKPLTLAGLRGRVVLVDFWTYTCINCIRTLPYMRAWDAAYRSRGLTIVGVHTPEFQFEHDAGNVRDAIAQNRLRYPVAQDNDYKTWNAWGNEYWPADYLIDAKGRVRYVHFGEGDDKQTEAAIRSLLAEAGAESLGAGARVGPTLKPGHEATPETYLGSARAKGWLPATPVNGTHDFHGPGPFPFRQSRFAFTGRWRIDDESATAVSGASVDAHVVGKAVYLVLSSAGDRPRALRVELDGKPIRAADAGADVNAGAVSVRAQRLYRLVSLPRTEDHRLRLRFETGLSGYAFTFG
jgi:cytochrome c biogenesis protein CcdA/thiol-disulfide isomerase/thioredoxin